MGLAFPVLHVSFLHSSVLHFPFFHISNFKCHVMFKDVWGLNNIWILNFDIFCLFQEFSLCLCSLSFHMVLRFHLRKRTKWNWIQIQHKHKLKRTIFPLWSQLMNQEGCIPSSPSERSYSSKVCKTFVALYSVYSVIFSDIVTELQAGKLTQNYR